MLETLLAWDVTAARAIAGLSGWWPLDALMAAASAAGVWGAIWVALGLVLAFRHRGFVAQGFVRLLWGLLLTSFLTNVVLKPLVARPRPTRDGSPVFHRGRRHVPHAGVRVPVRPRRVGRGRRGGPQLHAAPPPRAGPGPLRC